ncbi:DNA-binding protein [Streptomyces sp. NPDC127108]|uniref:nSTAND1 domain-containing NTPase n=1 Tax=Streptomyces sp. NPDC127108 TaxID=3345361 RepID=UPI00362FABD1
MGRREKPLDPADGPVARFAVELRKMRQEAGAPSYRVMAQQAEYSVTALSQAAAGEKLPSLAVALAYARACGADPQEWERRWREVEREQAEESLDEREGDAEQSPYRGLTRYEPGDEGLFFGRERLTEDLLRRVRECRFTVVLGPSGGGKSSLLRAGLIPRLRRVDDAAERPAALRILTPGEHPLRTHTALLTPAAGDGDTWLIVDQFEEVFTLCRDPEERAAFIDGLLAARSPGSRLRVVLGVRADFYGRCAEHPALADVLSDASLLVTAMSAAELRHAVVKPAQVSGLIVERELTARLVKEAGSEPGALPLLSHALRETWRRRRGRTLTLQGYEDTGGVHGAIARTAEDVHAQLSDSRKEMARLILLRLIAPGEGAQDTRRPIRRAELDFGDRDEVDAVVDLLARARLITLDDDTVDLAHEALITSWPRLGAWVDAHRDRLRAHRHLTEAAHTWEELAHDRGALYRGARLTAAAEHFTADGDGCADLTGLELSFLTASRRARTRARRRGRALSGALAVLVVLSVIAGVMAWRESRTSERRHVEAEARRIAAAAATMRDHDPVTAMRLSVAAWRLAESTETRSALIGAMAQNEVSSFSRPGAASDVVATELTADGRTLVAVGAGRVRTWDMRELRPRARSYPGLGKLAADDAELTVSPDGRTLAVSTIDSTVMWDVRAGRVVSRLPASNGPGVVFSPDGKRVALTVWDVDGSGASDSGDDMGVPWGAGGSGTSQGAGGADAPAGAGRADHLESAGSSDVPEGPDVSSSKLFDVRSGRAVLTMKQRHPEKTESFALSADNRLLARCGEQGPLEIWDIPRRARLSRSWLAEDKKRFDCGGASFVFTPDSRHLARVTSRDIRRWDLRSGREAPRVEDQGLEDVRFSADDKFVMASTADGVEMWRLDAPGAPVLRQATVGDASWGFELDLDAGAVRYFNETRTVLHSLSVKSAVEAPWRKEYFSQGKLAADGRTQAVVRHTKGAKELRLVDTRSGRTVFEPPVEPCPKGSEDSPVSAGPDDVAPEELDAAEMTEAQQADNCSDLMAFSADGRYFAYGRARQLGDPKASKRERVTVWDVRKGRERATVVLRADEMGDSGLDGLVLSADGSLLFLARTSLSETTEVWDLRSGSRPEKVRTLKDISGALAIRPDSARVASWQAIADPRSGKTLRTSLSGTLTSELAFSPGGQYLAAGDAYGRVTVWDGTGHTRRAVLTAADSDAAPTTDEDWVSALAFSHDNTTLAVATHSGTIQLWDVPSSQPLGSPLPTPGDTITSLAFSADGRTLYAGGSHVPLQKYALAPARLVDAVCERAGSGLSRRDWRTYLPDLPYRATC